MKCPTCEGRKVIWQGTYDTVKCSTCNGTGEIKEDVCQVKQLTIEELREQFNNLDDIKPHLKSNEIMQEMINGLFAFYVECAKANGILKES